MEKLTGLSHLFVTVFFYGFASYMVIPAIIDVTMSAVCPGKDECSLAIYLTGIQQAIIGLGTVVMMPVIGYLSDKYGRKALLTVPMTLTIIPPAILAYSRDTGYFYAYYVLRTLTGLVCEGSVNSLSHAYVADNMSEQQRTSAFGILSGVYSASFLSGTLAARFLSTASTYQVAVVASILGAVYMRVFLKESVRDSDEMTRPILKGGPDDQNDGDHSSRKIPIFKNILCIGDIIYLLKRSTIFLQAAVVAFFFSLQDSGAQASLLYFLKARFEFTQTQFAELMLTFGVARVISVLLLLPVLAPAVSEKRLLSVGLFMTFLTMFLFSISWSVWVPYAATVCTFFIGFVPPCLRSIASKQVAPNEQGMAQGCISGIESFSNIISPLIFSPLTAWFLSEGAPFDYPGFSLLCIALTSMIAFVQSVMIKAVPPSSSHEINYSCVDV